MEDEIEILKSIFYDDVISVNLTEYLQILALSEIFYLYLIYFLALNQR